VNESRVERKIGAAEFLKSKTLSISIGCDPGKVYEFISNPENLPKWAKAFCRSIKKSSGEWVVETPEGPVKVRFVAKNDSGILDHYVSLVPGAEIFVPMRVVPNGHGSEVIFTLFQLTDTPNKKFTEDIRWVEQDLNHLKMVMKKR